MVEGKKYSLSVVTLTKDSEAKIRDCLESVKWCDDIVIVDDFSQDHTLEVAGEYTDRIFKRQWENEGRHRNFAYSQAKNEYILSLDSDERVTPELKEELIQLIEQGFKYRGVKYNGYNIPHRNYISNTWIRYGGWYPNKKLKLFKKSEFRYEEAEPHPRAIMEGERKDLKGEIVHLVYKDFSDLVLKVNYHTDYEARKWVKDKRKVSLPRMLRKASDRFWKAYLLKQGFRDGGLGFIMAFFGGFYQLLTYAKYMELKDKDKG